MAKLTLEKLAEIRPDLAEAKAEAHYENFLNESFPSVYYTFNFVFLLDAENRMNKFRRNLYPDIAEKVDLVVNEEGFDMSDYNKGRDYFGTREAHEKAFPIYKKVHEKFGVPYEDLMFGPKK